MEDWISGVLIIASAIVGAFTGIFGQVFYNWLVRPKLSCILKQQSGQLQLYVMNKGRRSTRELRVSVMVDYHEEDNDVPIVLLVYDVLNASIPPKDSLTYRIGGYYDSGLVFSSNTHGNEPVPYTFEGTIKIKVVASCQDVPSSIIGYKGESGKITPAKVVRPK